ncbi:LPS-assembly protein LptD [Oceaniovalibus sp. ACAM 378]|uniref:LPS-assembly protein LptD n=1 Tax=Oceaniovalibus sp. ACAM 378 TaxID=2599923 RepID=UPI002103FCAF|nr:LPS assembly protein LptD [Oceaniovalibus sp. ACAM 378]
MMRRLMILLALIFLFQFPGGGKAQQLATLVADRVELTGQNTLVATGNVEVLYQGTRLQARRVTYSSAGETLLFDGPITLVEGDGRVILIAEQAELDSGLRNGILTSARLVLDQQLQLAANEIARVDGRYTQLSNTVVSSCEVCAGNPVPVWEIRARRVIHDKVERQIYFQNAQFRFLGVPIFYTPRLRLPDPSLTRATGFMLPSLRTTSRLKTGVKVPYFIRLNDQIDLTLTPYLSSATRTLDLRYRHAFRAGDLSFEGAISRDNLLVPRQTRYYLFGEGRFDLPRDFKLDFDIEIVSDTAYLIDYGFSDKDRLDSEIKLSRARARDLFRASVTDFRTLRDSEEAIRDQLPRTFANVSYERRIALIGGEFRLGFDAASLTRTSNAPGVGRDVSRIGVSGAFRRDWTLANGMLAIAEMGIQATTYDTRQDPSFATTTAQITPRAMIELRWPFQRTDSSGAYHLLEPVVQLAWSETNGNAVPNEDSVLVEFDEGNLFDLGRFPGEDAREQGSRANIGLRWTRYDPAGWTLGVTVGRVLRNAATTQFAPGTGLAGKKSNWLAAGQLRIADRLAVTHRALFDDGFDFTRSETRLAWQNERTAIGSSYLWMIAEPTENRPIATHELAVDAAYRMSRHWTGRLDGRFDLAADRASKAGLGLEYRSECLVVDLSLSRRFTSSTSLSASTDFGLNVSLAGFGSGRNDESYRRRCSR